MWPHQNFVQGHYNVVNLTLCFSWIGRIGSFLESNGSCILCCHILGQGCADHHKPKFSFQLCHRPLKPYWYVCETDISFPPSVSLFNEPHSKQNKQKQHLRTSLRTFKRDYTPAPLHVFCLLLLIFFSCILLCCLISTLFFCISGSGLTGSLWGRNSAIHILSDWGWNESICEALANNLWCSKMIDSAWRGNVWKGLNNIESYPGVLPVPWSPFRLTNHTHSIE